MGIFFLAESWMEVFRGVEYVGTIREALWSCNLILRSEKWMARPSSMENFNVMSGLFHTASMY